MRVLGIDPGLRVTGYGVVDWLGGRISLVEAGTIESRAQDPLAKRVFAIHRSICEILDELKPEVMSMEALYSHYEHPKTAIIMGHARGGILLAAAQRDIPIHSYSATRIKKSISGSGAADKAQVQRAVQHALSLKETPNPPDVADALAAALCHCNVVTKGLFRIGRMP